VLGTELGDLSGAVGATVLLEDRSLPTPRSCMPCTWAGIPLRAA